MEWQSYVSRPRSWHLKDVLRKKKEEPMNAMPLIPETAQKMMRSMRWYCPLLPTFSIRSILVLGRRATEVWLAYMSLT